MLEKRLEDAKKELHELKKENDLLTDKEEEIRTLVIIIKIIFNIHLILNLY